MILPTPSFPSTTIEHHQSWLAQRARMTPNHPALIFHKEEITFSQLYRRMLDRAQQLIQLCIRPGDIVALLLKSSPQFVELFHAIPFVRAVVLPLNNRLTAEEIGRNLKEAKVRLLIHGEGELEHLAHESIWHSTLDIPSVKESNEGVLELTRGSVVSAQTDSASSIKRSDAMDNANPPLALLYTSGSTGKPKGVPLYHHQFYASAVGAIAHIGLVPKERWLACMPLFHIGGLSILTRSVILATTVVLHEHFDEEAVSNAIDQQEVTLVSMVPTMLQRLIRVREGHSTTNALRGVLLGGGPISPDLIEIAAQHHIEVLPTYGLTEACSQVATRPIQNTSNHELKPLINLELRIVDREGETLATGQQGEIVVKGPMIMQGYWNDKEASTNAVRNGWLFTGDMGFLCEDYSLFVIGRRIAMIITGGENVYPEEVEAVLNRHPQIESAQVKGEADNEFGQCVVAWIIRKENSAVTKTEIQQYCRQRLAGFKVPRRIHFCRKHRESSGWKSL